MLGQYQYGSDRENILWHDNEKNFESRHAEFSFGVYKDMDDECCCDFLIY